LIVFYRRLPVFFSVLSYDQMAAFRKKIVGAENEIFRPFIYVIGNKIYHLHETIKNMGMDKKFPQHFIRTQHNLFG
jgi:hypothetical protein